MHCERHLPSISYGIGVTGKDAGAVHRLVSSPGNACRYLPVANRVSEPRPLLLSRTTLETRAVTMDRLTTTCFIVLSPPPLRHPSGLEQRCFKRWSAGFVKFRGERRAEYKNSRFPASSQPPTRGARIKKRKDTSRIQNRSPRTSIGIGYFGEVSFAQAAYPPLQFVLQRGRRE